MRKAKKKVKKKSLGKIRMYRLAIIGIIFVTGVFLIRALALQTKPVVETPMGEVHTVPPDVKKELSTQVLPASTSAASFRVPILLYHYVEYVQDRKDIMRQKLDITPDTFESQVKTLSQANYTFMTAKDLGEVLNGKRQLPKNPVLLTFDDGHWDFDTVILPILKKYHAKATAYIISGFIGGSDFMSAQQLQDVYDSHLVDVGAHTVNHISLGQKLLPIVSYEVTQSKKMLESAYHVPVVSFAYPNGSFDQQAIDTVKKAGFTTAVSTIPGISQSTQNRFFLYRIRPGYRTGQELLSYLQQNQFKAY